MALALVRRIVHRHQQPLVTSALPGKNQETIPGPVAIPSGNAFEQLPLAVAHSRMAQHRKQPIVKLFKFLIDRLVRPSNQMGRDPFCSPFELSLMKETQPGREERDDGRGFMDFWRKRRSRPRL